MITQSMLKQNRFIYIGGANGNSTAAKAKQINVYGGNQCLDVS